MKRHPSAENIGSISQGTMRTEDLLPSFLSELLHQEGLTDEHKALHDRAQSEIDTAEEEGTLAEYYDSEAAESYLCLLFDVLNSYSPSYFYFASHDGDGADYGYWLDRDSLAEAIHNGDVLDIGDDWGKVPEGYVGEILYTSDHGNGSLYCRDETGEDTELWAIV